MDNDAQFLALGDIYDRLTEQQQERQKGVQLPALLTCSLQRRLVPHGEHLTKKCRNWMVRREQEIGWCPEVA